MKTIRIRTTLPQLYSKGRIRISQNDDNFFYGIELEFYFAPSTVTLASLADVMDTEDLTNMLGLFEIDSHLLQDQMFTDRENEELVLKPMTLATFQKTADSFTSVLSALNAMGYRVYGLTEEIGLHVSICRSRLSWELLDKTVRFLFANRETFLAITRRKNRSSSLGDLNSKLGNALRKKSNKEIEASFEQSMKELKYIYDNRIKGEILGIRTYNDREYIQFTHFNSTLEVSELIATIEFLDAVTFFVEENKGYDWAKFREFINTSSRKYIYLDDYLSKIEKVVNKWVSDYKILLETRN